MGGAIFFYPPEQKEEATMVSQLKQNLLSYQEVADILGLKPNTLRAWVSARKIPFVKLGSAVRFTPKMVDEIIEKSTRGAIT